MVMVASQGKGCQSKSAIRMCACDPVWRKGRDFTAEFMKNNCLLIPTQETMTSSMSDFLKFAEQFRGIPGSVCFGGMWCPVLSIHAVSSTCQVCLHYFGNLQVHHCGDGCHCVSPQRSIRQECFPSFGECPRWHVVSCSSHCIRSRPLKLPCISTGDWFKRLWWSTVWLPGMKLFCCMRSHSPVARMEEPCPRWVCWLWTRHMTTALGWSQQQSSMAGLLVAHWSSVQTCLGLMKAPSLRQVHVRNRASACHVRWFLCDVVFVFFTFCSFFQFVNHRVSSGRVWLAWKPLSTAWPRMLRSKMVTGWFSLTSFPTGRGLLSWPLSGSFLGDVNTSLIPNL